ncbi:DoxX family membrane protein [Actinosynnema sp. NPDC047251]|uniref:Putative membrane protein n=1 Tax=Saccharothrix espanaensis (strain ATCC 51144 / DSM 44229 / JCM 9112 / NBRC 15066 / NRRL 15764) TaxID=1179773 RepID=K0JXE2_SACES|nr:DoxX family membrane protein [Saccharothrix espanaensis]CCH30756.1 putative membrane protein [Saccharothrix espanaensis DSM 44229]
MEPLIILVTVTLALLAARALGLTRIPPWPFAVRMGLAGMFTATGIAHFVGLRAELVAMVPPALPAPELLVTVTGVLELTGAAGLLWHRTARWSAIGLTVMLVGMFPANVYAASQGLSRSFGDQLLPRTIMQLVFLAATVAVVVGHRKSATKLDRAASVSV